MISKKDLRSTSEDISYLSSNCAAQKVLRFPMAKVISSQLIKISAVSSLRRPMHNYLKNVLAPRCVNGTYNVLDSILIAIDKNQLGRANEICRDTLELTQDETDLYLSFAVMTAKDTMMGVRELYIKQEGQKARLMLFQKLQDKLQDIIKTRTYYQELGLNVAIATGKMESYYKEDLDFSPESELVITIAGEESRARMMMETFAATM